MSKREREDHRGYGRIRGVGGHGDRYRDEPAAAIGIAAAVGRDTPALMVSAVRTTPIVTATRIAVKRVSQVFDWLQRQGWLPAPIPTGVITLLAPLFQTRVAAVISF